MKVNIALLTVTDTRTFDNDKSGAILVDKIKEANHILLDRKICKDNKDEIILILKAPCCMHCGLSWFFCVWRHCMKVWSCPWLYYWWCL